MNFIRQHKFFRFFWLMMTVLFINISIDPVDPEPDWVPEDLSINKMESIIELVVEKILGFEDAFKEYDDDDLDSNTGIQVVVDFSQCASIEKLVLNKPVLTDTNNALAEYFNRFKSQFISEINAPPPKRAA